MKTPSDTSLINLRNPLQIDNRTPLLIGHRGGVVSSRAPENSLNAIHLAGEQSYDMVELDIAEANDKEPVLFHGWNGHLGVDCGVDAFVFELDSVELMDVKYRESDQCIASLPQALEVCRKHDLGVMLDLKGFGLDHSAEFYLRIAKLFKTYDLSGASLTFSQDPMAYEHLSEDIKFALSENEFDLFVKGELGIVKGRWWFALPDEATPELVEGLQENSCIVIVAINRFRYPTHVHELIARKDIERLVKMGVDGLQIDSIYAGFLDVSIVENN